MWLLHFSLTGVSSWNGTILGELPGPPSSETKLQTPELHGKVCGTGSKRGKPSPKAYAYSNIQKHLS